MAASQKSRLGLVAVLTFGAFAGGCDGGMDLGLGHAKDALVGKPAPTPNLPDRPALAMPSSNAPLPVPGQATQTAAQWRPAEAQPAQQASEGTEAKSGGSSWYSGLFGSSDQKKTQ